MEPWVSSRHRRFVYLVRCGDEIKVGSAFNIRTRLMRHRNEKKASVHLLGFIRCDRGGWESIKVEREFQSQYVPVGQKCEWAAWNPPVVSKFLSDSRATICLGGERWLARA